MPRRGLDAARVIAAAGDIADAEGVEAMTLAGVAAALGVRAPSLYNHVGSREAVLAAVAAGAMHDLAAALRDAAVGRAGADALHAAARAYRDYAHAHPGRYELVQRGPRGDPASAAAAADTVGVLVAVLRGFGLEGDDALHGVRALRSALHGFVSLEAAGGFRLDLDCDISFARLVDLLGHGLASSAVA